MPLSNAARQRRKELRTCYKKKRLGIIWSREETAQRAAARIKRKDPESNVRAFQCPICGHWHIGNPIGVTMAKTKDNGIVEQSQAIVPVKQMAQWNAVRNLQEAIQIAEIVSKYAVVPGVNNIGQALIKILCGAEMGFGPFASLTGVHMIEGKPSVGARLMGAAIKDSGKYNYRPIERSYERCELAFFEKDEKGVWQSAGPNISLSMQKAIETGLAMSSKTGKMKDNYRVHGDDMLFARCVSKGFNTYCPDLCGGIRIYATEELLDDAESAPQIASPTQTIQDAEIVRPDQLEHGDLKVVEGVKYDLAHPQSSGPTGEQFNRYDDLIQKLKPSTTRMSQVFANKGAASFMDLTPEQAEEVLNSMQKGWMIHQEALAKKQEEEKQKQQQNIAAAVERAKEAGKLKAEAVPTPPGTSSPEVASGSTAV